MNEEVDCLLYVLDTTAGELLWRYRTESAIWVGPVISEGVADQGPGDRYLFSLDAASAELVWRHTGDDAR